MNRRTALGIGVGLLGAGLAPAAAPMVGCGDPPDASTLKASCCRCGTTDNQWWITAWGEEDRDRPLWSWYCEACDQEQRRRVFARAECKVCGGKPVTLFRDGKPLCAAHGGTLNFG